MNESPITIPSKCRLAGASFSRVIIVAVGTIIATFASDPTLGGEGDWPQFRGSAGAGASSEDRLPVEWSPDKNLAWSIEVPGSGYSSPIVWGDKIFITTAIPDKKEEDAPRGMRAESVRYSIPDITYDWQVLCLSLTDGSLLWQKSVKVGKATKGKHTKNSYATETACTDGTRVFAYFSQAGLYAFDLDGNLLWEQHPTPFDTYLEYGTSSSPITDGKYVYLQCDYQENSAVAAYDAKTGAEVWKVYRDEMTSWSTPFLWTNSVRRELVTVAPRKARAYDPETGSLLWELGGMSDYTVPIPIADDRACYISSGFLVNPRNRPIFAVLPGASGDITLPDDADSSNTVLWRNKLAGPYVPSPILYRGRLWVVHDRPLFDCLDVATGKPHFPRKRFPSGGNFTASPVAFDGKLLCLTEEGIGYVLRAGDEFKIVATNPPLDDDGLFLATPAIAHDNLLIRGFKQLHCIRSGKSP